MEGNETPEIKQITQEANEEFKILNISVLRILVGALIFLLSIYFINFRGDFGSQGDFGAFGDYIGGLLNPILSFVAILLLIRANHKQAIELSLTRKEFIDANELNLQMHEIQRKMIEVQERNALVPPALEAIKEIRIFLKEARTETIFSIPENTINDRYNLNKLLSSELLKEGIKEEPYFHALSKFMVHYATRLMELSDILFTLHQSKAPDFLYRRDAAELIEFAQELCGELKVVFDDFYLEANKRTLGILVKISNEMSNPNPD
ncbi:MAG: hypothetical protein Alis3KO_00930 [Aliiglaciecola sp.]